MAVAQRNGKLYSKDNLKRAEISGFETFYAAEQILHYLTTPAKVEPRGADDSSEKGPGLSS